MKRLTVPPWKSDPDSHLSHPRQTLPAAVWRPIHSLPTLNMTTDRSRTTEQTPDSSS